ncbi:MAG: phenylalanine--tRNA ligase subunit beta, partial [Myxococcota bacterium]|nr:phenylalanine--tRNA ligase subunit beta [Myxococcota bacterium]
MKLSLEWLEDFVEVPELDALCHALTEAGVEVEEVSNPAMDVSGVLVAQVESCENHPKADKLKVCQVDDGAGVKQVICGAPNVEAGQKIAFAAPGAHLHGLDIAERAIRGVNSQGMICSMEELGLASKSDGIWVLPADWEIGQNIFTKVQAKPVLTLWITPNRPDLLSHKGLSREIAAAFDLHLKGTSWRLVEQGYDASNYAQIAVEDAQGCPKYCGRVVRDVKVGPSPDWLANRLESVGIRSINNVVDATNYVLMEYGHPLHAFDLNLLAKTNDLPGIVVRRARDGEMMTTLDDVERKLDVQDLVIADGEKVLALAGVMGAAESEVCAETSDVLLESAYFEPTTVRQSGRRHGLHTEASARFERGADPEAIQRSIDRCAHLIAELAGGTVCRGTLEISSYESKAVHIHLDLKTVERVLGLTLSAQEVVALLEPIEIHCENRNDTNLTFSRPSYRQDLRIEVDLIEEVARRYGYNRIPTTLPDSSQQSLSTVIPEDRLER